MDISRHISDLLFEHECVVLPGLGGFIANDRPATVNRITHHFSPPSKKLVFNVHLTANDGLLINYVARKEGLTYEEAKQYVREFTDACRKQMEEGEKVVFKKIGVLYKNSGGHLTFEQDKKENYNPEAFGLSSFYSPAIDRGTDEERLRKIVEPILTGKQQPKDRKAERQTAGTKKRYRTAASILTLLLLLLLIGGGYTFTENARSYWNNYAALIPVFNPADLSEEKTDIAPVNDKMPAKRLDVVAEEKSAAETNNPKLITKKVIRQPKNTPDNTRKIPEIRSVSGSYLIIAGSFSKEKNAQKLIRRLQQKGVNAIIADTSKSGMYRVALASYTSLGEAKEKLYVLRDEQYPDAWILRKK